MDNLRLWKHIILIIFCATIFLFLSSACQSNTALDAEVPDKYKQKDYKKPPPSKHKLDYYKNILKLIPLDVDEKHQNLSNTDTVVNHKAWVVGVYPFYNNGVKDLYILFSNNHIYRVLGDKLTIEWTVDLERRPSAPPAISSKYVYWLTAKHNIAWYHRERQPEGYQKVEDKYLQITPSAPPAATDTGIFIPSSEYFRVYCYSDKRKIEEWFWPSAKLGIGSVTMKPYSDGDRLYFYNNNGKIYSISTDDGTQKWSLDVLNMNANFSVKHDYFFIPSWTTKLMCMDKSKEVKWAFNAEEPIVTTPFVEDHYVVFQTPRYMYCIKYYYNRADTGKSARTWIRLVDAENPNREANEPLWKIPIVHKDYLKGGKEEKKYKEDELYKKKGIRMQLEVLMKGSKWFYVLMHKSGGKKFLKRIDAETGAIEKSPKEGYDVSMFPYIIGSNDEQDRSIYFVTHQGYILAMREPQ